MPSINGNTLGLWRSIKARSQVQAIKDSNSGIATSSFHRFSAAYDSGPGPSRGNLIFLFVMTGFFILLIVIGVVVFRMVVRHRAVKLGRAKEGKESALEGLGFLEGDVTGADAGVDMNVESTGTEAIAKAKGSDGSGSDASLTSMPTLFPAPTPAPAPMQAPAPTLTSTQAPTPALQSPEPRYGYPKTAPVLEDMSASVSVSVSAEGGKVPTPTIIVNSIEEDLSVIAEASSNILPRDDYDLGNLEGTAGGQEQLERNAGTTDRKDKDRDGDGDGDANKSGVTSYSCFSDEMLETMSSIAADLKLFNIAKSIDVEIKSVESKRSSILLVGSAEPVACSAETVEAMIDPEISFDLDLKGGVKDKDSETLEDILSDIERMVGKNSLESLSCYSEESYPMATMHMTTTNRNSTLTNDFVEVEVEVGDESDDSCRTLLTGAETSLSASAGDMTLTETAPLVVKKSVSSTSASIVVKDVSRDEEDAVLPIPVEI